MSNSNTEHVSGKITLPNVGQEPNGDSHVDNGQILYKLDIEDSLDEVIPEQKGNQKKQIHLMEGGLKSKDEESDEVSSEEFSIEDAVSGLSMIQFGEAAEVETPELEPTVIDVQPADGGTKTRDEEEDLTDRVSNTPPLFDTEPDSCEADPNSGMKVDESTKEHADLPRQTAAVTTVMVEETESFQDPGAQLEKELSLHLDFTGEETTDIDVHRIGASNPIAVHRKELRRLITVCAVFMGLMLIPYTTVALDDYRVWISGEPLPLIQLVQGDRTVAVSNDGVLSIEETPDKTKSDIIDEDEPKITRPPDDPTTAELKLMIPPISDRTPAKGEELLIPEGSMDAYFKSLALIEDGSPTITRALVWGDSTIANDGVIKNVRKRFQAQFGDGGPGFLAVQVDPKWSIRRDILRRPTAGWKTRTIVFGGAHSGRYGLAGTVSTAYGPAKSRLGGVKIDGERQLLNRFKVFYESQPKGGKITAKLGDRVETISTSASNVGHGFKEITSEEGISELKIATSDGRVTIYGVSMETEKGATWETFGVAGSSVRSMRNQPKEHIKAQVSARDPQLVVYWTGGNELGYPSLKSKTGRAYKNLYRRAIEKIKSGAPNASCLLIGPLDQGVRERGKIKSKKTLKKIIQFQSEVAKSMGCAYWNARASMGGEGAIKRWRHHKPALASGDLAHLTGKGRALIGESLADALLYSYQLWKMQNPHVRWKATENVAITEVDDTER